MNTINSKDPILGLNRVKKTILEKHIVRGLTFDVYSGDVFGFLGPNGAGKTTTICMMVGLMSISKGDIIIQGTSVSRNPGGAMHVGTRRKC